MEDNRKASEIVRDAACILARELEWDSSEIASYDTKSGDTTKIGAVCLMGAIDVSAHKTRAMSMALAETFGQNGHGTTRSRQIVEQAGYNPVELTRFNDTLLGNLYEETCDDSEEAEQQNRRRARWRVLRRLKTIQKRLEQKGL